jgi:hypothetical protein
MTFKELKNPLENRPTVLRAFRSITTDFTLNEKEWNSLNSKVYLFYKSLTNTPLKKVNQKRIYGVSKSKKKVNEYPLDFIPVMLNIIKDFIKNR